MNKINILFVCMGNLCRSPTAEAVFRHCVAEARLTSSFAIDSAGTHASHNGDPPDARAQRFASQRGYDLSKLRTRQLMREDFVRFDYLLAMDDNNLAAMRQASPAEHTGKLSLLMTYSTSGVATGIPDPYYGGAHGFERVLDMVEDAAQGFLRHIRTGRGL
jgi:protein-tyrosine phosphatase